MSAQTMPAIESVQRYWGNDAPEWVVALAQECDQSSRKKVGKNMPSMA